MSRKKLAYSLPLLRRPPTARGRDLSDAELVEIFRDIALAHRRADPQPFYPIREAAAALKVPISSVLRAYAQLKKEGLLSTVRGSRTVLQGRRSGRRLNIKSLISLPVSYSCFMTLQDYRTFYLELRREAQLRGFVCSLIFYDENSRGLEELVKRLDEFSVDSVVWFLPRIAVRDTILHLRDGGIQVLCVADGGSPGIYCRYEIHREKAVEAIFRDWKSKAGINSITIARTSKRSAADEEMLEHAAEKAKLACVYRNLREEAIADFEALLGKHAEEGVVLPATPAALLSLRAPQGFAKLLETCRTALPDGPITTILESAPDTPVDLITVNWRSVAKRIVGDVARRRAFKEIRPTVFEGAPRIRAPLSRYAETV